MAYYSLNAYDADVRINSFAGLYQYGDNMNGDVRFAVDMANVETPAGVLQPMAATEEVAEFTGVKIETLAHLFRRWYVGSGSAEVLFAAMDGKIFYTTADQTATASWTELPFPTGVTEYQSNVWSWAAYEINPEGSVASVDVLLMSNALDGMIMIRGDNFTVEAVETPKKFGVIERYAERIWGGGITDDPDMLVYSAPYDPTDWEANEDDPAEGAGDISQPSWDGDSFTALRAFGSQLIAFKKHRVWRVLGTDPGEYTFKEQYGGGAAYFNTIAIDVERIFMAEKDGVSVYDGLAVDGYQRQAIDKLWRSVNRAAMDQMCAVLYKKKYYLAVPTGNSAVNNELIVFNLADGTILRYTGIYIESFLATEDVLYATSSVIPGKILKVNWDSWETGNATTNATFWVSQWMDFGYKKIKKGGFDLYFTPEVQDRPVTLTFKIQTEKKIKSKRYTIQPLTANEIANNKFHKQKRLHFGGTGRRFRLIIETDGGSAPWRLIGGIQMIVETDPD